MRLNSFRYRIHGISIKSEIELPDLLLDSADKFDVVIQYGNVPQHLPDIQSQGVLYEAAENDFLFKFESVAKYRVQNGNLIIVDPNKDSSNEDISLFLMGSVMGALLHQRGLLVLHGSSVIIKNRAVIITGHSTAGKSTLAAGLNEAGFPILTDDLSTISFNNSNNIYVHSGFPYIRLWRDVIEKLQIKGELQKVRTEIEKYKKSISYDNIMDKYEVGLILNLSKRNTTGFSFDEIKGMDKFDILKTNTYRTRFIEGLNMAQSHFNNVTKLIEKIPLYKIERPSEPLLIYELTDYVKSVINPLL
ncbi:MAG: hypothetical protein ABFS12_11500 [Bacteroidota bacterium]